MKASAKVLITGATSGIGEAILAQFAVAGCEVFACGRNQEKLTRLQTQFPTTISLRFDVTLEQEIAEAAAQVDSLDILILNAGDCAYIDNAKQFDGTIFNQIIDTNLRSVGFLLEHFLPKLRAGGQLVFISSSATILPFPRTEAYGASKAGLDYLANSLRIDLFKENISVTLIHPGFVKTPLTDKNTFAMPFMISSTEAAEKIYQAVLRKKRYCHFPKRLTILLKLMAFLPQSIWFWFATRSV